MNKTLTLADLDLLFSKLAYKKNSEEKRLLSILRSYYSTDQDLQEKRSIKSDEIIQKLWPYPEEYGKTEKNYLKEKRKVLSDLKSDINKMCRDLFWKDSNPERIGIGRFNTVTVLKETKFDEVHHLKAEVQYLKNIVSEIVPSAMNVVRGEGSAEDLKKIQKAVSGISKPAEEDTTEGIEKENLHFEPLPLQEKLLKSFFHKESERMASTLEALNARVIRIKESVERGELTEEEGQRKLRELESEQDKTSHSAEKLMEAMEKTKEEDPELAGVFEKIKKSLKEFIGKKGLSPEEDMGLILEEGLKALERIERTEVGGEEAGYEGKEDVEEEFKRIKEEARVLLGQFKELSRAMKLLLEKKKTEAGLTEEEVKVFAGYEAQFNGFKTEGAKHLMKLREIETKAQGALKEAVVLIISSLERFVGKSDVKQEVLRMVEKNKKVVDDLKEGEARFRGKGALDLEKEKEEFQNIDKEYERIRSEISRKKSDLIRAREEKLHLDNELTHEGVNKGLNEKLKDARDDTRYLSVELEKILEETEEGMEQAIEDGTVEKLSKNLERITRKGQKIYERIKKIVSREERAKEKEGQKLDEETAGDLLYVLNAESKKIVDQYKELNISYEKIQKDIEEKTVAMDRAREEVEKLEEKRKFLETKAQAETEKIGEIEKKLGEGMSESLHEALQSARQSYSSIRNTGVTLEEFSGKVVFKYKEMESQSENRPVIDVHEESTRIAQKLEELNEKVLKIKEGLESGEISEEEGRRKLRELEAERDRTNNAAERLVKALDAVKEAEAPELAAVFEKIKKSLKEYIGKKGLKPEEDVGLILEEGLKALEKIEKTELGGKAEAGYEGKESAEEEFKKIKENARALLGQFKELSRVMKPLLEKKKTEAGLTEEENKLLAGYEAQFNGFKTEGEKLLGKLKELEKKAQGALKEAVVLIISSLERFVGKSDVKQEVLRMVEKNSKVVEDIHQGNTEIEKASLASQKNKAKAEKIEKEIVVVPKSEDAETAVDKTARSFIENSRLVKDAREQSLKILGQLEALNVQAEAIQTDISSGKISEEEGQLRLAKINIERRKTEYLEKRLYSSFAEIQQEKDMDPLLAKALNRIKSNLQNLILDKKIADSDSLQALIDEGLKAMNEFEKGYNAEVKDAKEYEGKDSFEKQFEILKEKAKKFLDEFRPLQKQVSSLLEKMHTPGGLTPDENQSLAANQERYMELQSEGEDILDHLIEIEGKAEGALKEAIKLIVSALKRFVGRKETKEEVLMLVNKNRNIADSLKDLDQEYNGVQQKIEATRGAILKAQEDSRMLDEQAKKLGIIGEKPVSASGKEIEGITPSKLQKIKVVGMEKIANRFWMDIYPVTFLQFKEFVDQTGYKTLAEKNGKSLVISKTGWVKLMDKGVEKIIFQGVGAASKKGACWHNPDGEEAGLMEFMKRLHYPAVHLTYRDALAYAEWKKKRLPTREEWVLAAFGDKPNSFPWENIRDIQKCNNKEAVFKNLSPVNYYLPNAFGLYDMIGNVWQWCESGDEAFKYIMGGCWNFILKEMESQFEFKTKPLECNNTIGFRCVMD